MKDAERFNTAVRNAYSDTHSALQRLGGFTLADLDSQRATRLREAHGYLMQAVEHLQRAHRELDVPR